MDLILLLRVYSTLSILVITSLPALRQRRAGIVSYRGSYIYDFIRTWGLELMQKTRSGNGY